MRACCHKAVIQLNRKDRDGFLKENLRYMFNVTVETAQCAACLSDGCPGNFLKNKKMQNFESLILMLFIKK